VVAVLVMMIVSLLSWLWRDLSGIFSIVISIFKS